MSRRPSARDVDVEVVDTEAGLLGLREEWEELWRAAAGRYQDSHEFAALSWRHVASARSDELVCLVLRADGRAVLIWPTTVHRRVGLRMVAPLGSGAADAVTILVRPGAEDLLDHAWRSLVDAARADALMLPFMEADSGLHRLALSSAGQVVHETTGRVSSARLRGHRDWDAYRGRSARKETSRKLRRLAGLGELRQREVLGVPDDRAAREAEDLVAWILHHRLRRGDDTGAWLDDPAYRRFLVASLCETSPSEPLARIFVLDVDGEPASALICGTGVHSVHPQVTAFDARYARHSPGVRPFEQAGRWALAHDRDLDLGPGDEEYKTRLARGHEIATVNLTLALTTRARLAFGVRDRVGRLLGEDRAVPEH